MSTTTNESYAVQPLPAVDAALATTWVSESIEGIGVAWQSIVREADACGLALGGGPCREVYSATAMDEGGSTWVVEIQQPVFLTAATD